jgi:predicted membrane channel-forming protein YqfA (hemolysin III family)
MRKEEKRSILYISITYYAIMLLLFLAGILMIVATYVEQTDKNRVMMFRIYGAIAIVFAILGAIHSILQHNHAKKFYKEY